jgi:hypothetical protein
MKHVVQLEVSSNKLSFLLEFFKSISFIKKVKVFDNNEITNPKILSSIEEYETKKTQPTPMSIEELKKMIHV